MKASKNSNIIRHCPSCGAPVSSEFCPYCGVATGLKSSHANMEYPVLECRELVVNRDEISFDLMMGAVFGGIALLLLILYFTLAKSFLMVCIALPMLLFALYIAAIPLSKYLRIWRVNIFGKTIPAKVYGYLDDNMTINGQTAQIVKLLVKTDNGPRFLLYQLYTPLKPYGINDEIKLKAYKDYYFISKNHGNFKA